MTVDINGLRNGTYYDNDFENNIYKKVYYKEGKPIWEITIDRPIWYWECFISTRPNHNPKAKPKNLEDCWKTKKYL